VSKSTSGRSGNSDRLTHGYRWVCVIDAVVGVTTAVAFLAADDGFMAAFFAVLTLAADPGVLLPLGSAPSSLVSPSLGVERDGGQRPLDDSPGCGGTVRRQSASRSNLVNCSQECPTA
jgi:hypothetical protein